MDTNSTTKTQMPAAIDDIYSEVNAVVHQLTFLTTDLEFAFAVRRGKADVNGGVTLQFRESRIDATLWLVYETWSRATDLQTRVLNLQSALDAEDFVSAGEAQNDRAPHDA